MPRIASRAASVVVSTTSRSFSSRLRASAVRLGEVLALAGIPIEVEQLQRRLGPRLGEEHARQVHHELRARAVEDGRRAMPVGKHALTLRLA
jgi:imidazolonepropionase-like amidohydrolase